ARSPPRRRRRAARLFPVPCLPPTVGVLPPPYLEPGFSGDRVHDTVPVKAATSSSAVSQESNSCPTCAFVPRSGSRVGIRTNDSRPTSNITESQEAAAIAFEYFSSARPRKYALVSSGGVVIASRTSSSLTSRFIDPRLTRRL